VGGIFSQVTGQVNNTDGLKWTFLKNIMPMSKTNYHRSLKAVLRAGNSLDFLNQVHCI